MTCLRASRATKNSGTSAGSATGSSRYQTISGSAATNSSGLTTLAMWRAPIASAEATATSISENPSRSKPVVNVISRGLCRMASAAIAVESMPPERNAPTVTSARMCLATESSSTAVISS